VIYCYTVDEGDLFMDYYYENRHHLMDDALPVSIYINKDLDFRAHWHQEFELVYVTSGSMEISINNSRRKLVAGEMSLCPGGQIHYYESQEPNESLLLIFKPEFIGFEPNWPETVRFVSPFVTTREVSRDDLAALYQLLKAILYEKSHKGSHYDLMLRSQLTELCVSLLRLVPKEEGRNPIIDDRNLSLIHQVLDYIDHHYTESLSLKGLAKIFNVDHYNLSKKFNAMTGSGLKVHIHTLRIAKAEQLILSEDITLLEVAMACGFESVRTFNRSFKNIKGYPPSQLRKD